MRQAICPDIRTSFSIGGPRYNEITEYLIGVTGSPFKFARTAEGRPCIQGADEAFVSDGNPEKPTKCFGVLVRASQPGRQSKVQNFTFIAGLSSVSTWAGAVMLTQFETFWDRFTEKAQGIRLKQPKIAIVYQIDIDLPLRFSPSGS
jgi:hypothetical protein